MDYSMARVTIEDCLVRVKNRFLLCLVASERAIALNEGTSFSKIPVNEAKPEKSCVTALREIAMGYVLKTDEMK